MGIYLNPNNRLFQMMLNSKFYVDKTGLAAFVNERMGTDGRFMAVSRPRRFGKSVDANMLAAYYSKGCDSRGQFEGLDVSRDSSFEEHLNAHDVIKLDVSQMLPLAAGSANVPQTIATEILGELRRAWPDAAPGDPCDLPKALQRIEDAKGSGFVFIIDEWDCIFREAAGDDAAQRAYLDFLRSLLKDRSYVDACYMTGILPIKKYGVHSALDIFTEYSVTDPKELAGLTGFNADEVERLCGRFGMDYAQMAYWYDGYLLGRDRLHVYNPRSVAGAIASGEFSSFWTGTETYEALRHYIDIGFDGVASDLLAMLDGQSVAVEVGDFDNSMTNFKGKDGVYALLVHLGYLGYDQVERCVFIPNEEIRREFVTSLRVGSRDGLARLARESRELVRRTVEGDAAYVADALQRAHSWAAAPRHYNDEQALRAAVKFAYVSAIDDYLRIDELPGGRGYADLAFVPKPGSALPPMVVELKWDKPVDAAIAQVRERNYPAALSGMPGECVLAGVTYHEGSDTHECAIERVQLP